MSVLYRIGRCRQIQLLPGDGLESRQQVKAQDMTEGKSNLALAVTIDLLALNLHVRTMAQHSFDHRRHFG